LNIVSAIRKKHKLQSHSEVSSLSESESCNDDNVLTFGIVDTDVSSSTKNDFEKEKLLVCREAKKKISENGIYPIQSIYSFFLVLSSDDLSRSSSQSPSSDGSDSQENENEEGDDDDDDDNEDEDETVSVSPDEAKDSPDETKVTSPSDSSKPSLFLAVKNHEENAWSVLAALHETNFDSECEDEGDDDEGSTGDGKSHFPDITVIVDPLRIIEEYIRYLQGEDAPPRTEQRKRRRVQVHESTVERSSCKIRILTPYKDDEESNPLSPAGHQEILQHQIITEQEELRKLLEQKLRELQQSIEQASHEDEEQKDEQEEEDLLLKTTPRTTSAVAGQ